MPEPRLTWHAGTVLPYASLWHTVLRVSALNALHARDLPGATTCPPRTVNLLDNHARGVNVAALAHELGEPAAALEWSTLDRLPDSLRAALVVPRPRLCLACLAAGYHAALFSVALLDACPIHRTPLVDRCHCGAPFHSTLCSLTDYGTAGSCRCGRLHFFTRETCRRPTLAPDRTHALDGLAGWLDALSGLIRPARLDEALCERAPGSLEWLITTAHALGLAYPACLRSATFARAPVKTVWYAPQPKDAPPRPRVPRASLAQADDNPSYWPATPATTVYRALARHVRRHLAPDGAQWVTRFKDSCDPFAIGEWVRCSDRAQRALTELLWGRAIEAGIEQRRWPHRAPPTGTRAKLAEVVEADCWVRGADGADAQTRHWLACHAARVSFEAIWRDAQAHATAAARSGIAAWADTSPGTSWRDSAWLARVTPLSVRFAAPVPATWSMAPRVSKALRQAAYATCRRARLDAMWAASRGACLSWSEAAGWHVIEAIAPVDAAVRRRRLLGWPHGRAWCWLYRTDDGGFVARWDHAPLQVLAATPGAAITALRRCASDYQRICHVALPFAPPSVPAVMPEPMDARLLADYQVCVAEARCTKAFWREANRLTEAARNYRRAQAQAPRTEASRIVGEAGETRLDR